jgi:hypothetical protein
MAVKINAPTTVITNKNISTLLLTIKPPQYVLFLSKCQGKGRVLQQSTAYSIAGQIKYNLIHQHQPLKCLGLQCTSILYTGIGIRLQRLLLHARSQQRTQPLQ